MKKSLSERIADRAQKEKGSQKAKNLAAFLAVRDDIRRALADGWSGKDVYDTLHAEGKITVSYAAFLGYVRRLLTPESPAPLPAPSADATPADTEPPPTPPEKRETVPVKPAMPSFTFQATTDTKELF